MKNSKKLSTLASIPYQEVYWMVKAFHDHQKQHPQYDSKLHVRSVFFDIDRIKTIYQKLMDEKADGLRIYLGRYPADVSQFDNPKPTPNTNTVIFVSTHVNDKGVPHSDYFIDEFPMDPENRGEQCEPNCQGVNADLKGA